MKTTNILILSLLIANSLQGVSQDDVFRAFQDGEISDQQMSTFDENTETRLLACQLQSFVERLENAPTFKEKTQVIEDLYHSDDNTLKKMKSFGHMFIKKSNAEKIYEQFFMDILL